MRGFNLLLGPLVAAIVWVIPLHSLTPEAHHLAAIIAWVVIYWVTEAIPIAATGIGGVCLAILTGVAPAVPTLASFGDPIIFLFLGAFILAKALQHHGVDQRIAYTILGWRWVGGSALRAMWVLGAVAFLFGMWMSITACTAMLYPVALAVAAMAKKDSRYTPALLLTLAYSAAAGAMATPVGTPPNLIGMALINKGLGIHIDFLQWIAMTLPIALALFVGRLMLVSWMYPVDSISLAENLESIQQKRRELGPWTAAQRSSLQIFAGAVFLWVFPGILNLILGPGHPLSKLATERLPPGVVAIGAATLLFIRPTITWEQAVKIDWGSIFLFGSGIAIGELAWKTGLAEAIGTLVLGPSIRSHSGLLTAVSMALTMGLSEVASNTAAANMIIPVILSALMDERAIALLAAFASTLAASLGFIFPVSTPAIAIIYGSGSLKMKDLVRAGIWVDLTGLIILWAFSQAWMPLVIRWAGWLR